MCKYIICIGNSKVSLVYDKDGEQSLDLYETLEEAQREISDIENVADVSNWYPKEVELVDNSWVGKQDKINYSYIASCI